MKFIAYLLTFMHTLTNSYQELGFTFSCFVIKARHADGSHYPHPKDSDLIRYHAFHTGGRRTRHGLLDAKDARFHDFRKTMGARTKELASHGIGMSVKQADPLTSEQKDEL